MSLATHEYRLVVRTAGKTHSLDCRQAFRFGYMLLGAGKYKSAIQVFQTMTLLEESNFAAAIMLAYCKAGLKDYKASKDVLTKVFADDAEADPLHTAFVYLSVGMWGDAIGELAKTLKQRPDLPVVLLLLAMRFWPAEGGATQSHAGGWPLHEP